MKRGNWFEIHVVEITYSNKLSSDFSGHCGISSPHKHIKEGLS